MGNFYRLFLFFSLVSLLACEKKTQQIQVVTDVDLSFRANFGDEPLIMNQEYDYDDDLKLFFSKFNFYISDLALLTEDCISGQIELTDIELIDFTDINTSDQAARDGFRLKFTNIPTGEYAGIRLSIGVSPELNREEPAVFSTSHPLGNPSQYWEGWKSYIFSKVEGRADTDQDGSFDLGYAYHMGGNAAFREICLLKNISLQEDQRTELDLNIDLRQLFITDDTTFDIETTPGTHTEEGLNTSVLLMDNFEEAFDIE